MPFIAQYQTTAVNEKDDKNIDINNNNNSLNKFSGFQTVINCAPSAYQRPRALSVIHFQHFNLCT